MFHAATVLGELLTRRRPPLASPMAGSRLLLRIESAHDARFGA